MRAWWCSVLTLTAGCDLAFGLAHVDPDAADADGLVAYYPMDTLGPDLGTCMPDVTGHHHDGSCLPGMPTIVAGQVGSAFGFDGMTAVRIPITGVLAEPTAFTFAAWLLLAGPTGCPFNRLLGDDLADSWQLCNGADLVFYFSGTTQAQQTSPLLVPGAWHHVAIVWDGAIASPYLDAAKLGDVPIAMTFDAGGIVLGMDLDRGAQTDPLTGAIDEVRIYDRALSGAEVLAIATQ